MVSIPEAARISVCNTLNFCDKGLFPNVYVLLQIFATLPVTVSEGERSFSSLRLLKSYLRNRSTDERHSSLALMYIHKKMDIDVEDIINRFASNNRRLKFQ